MANWGKTVGLLLGMLVLTLGFIAAYVEGLHNAKPEHVPVGVIRSDSTAAKLVTAVRPHLKPVAYADSGAATRALDRREVYAVLASTGTGSLALTTASANSPAAAELISEALTAAATSAGAKLAVTDAVVVLPGDPRGLVPFYLVVGLVLGGYLASTALGVTAGTTPRTVPRAAARIGALAVYAVLLGAAGAVLTGPLLGIFPDHWLVLAAGGALVVFAAGMLAAAVQAWVGLLGTGLLVLLLVALDNPGSGGVYPPEYMPGFLRGMHTWSLPGLGTDLVKSLVYFDRAAAGSRVGALMIWAVVSIGVLFGAAEIFGRRLRPDSL
ncbi:hypothetical protein WEI85_11245 [Actinomycetes bacterium KLBMP 9797]